MVFIPTLVILFTAREKNICKIQSSKIEKKYGVDKEIIVSLWGVETLFGEITGDYNVIRSLATLAYEGRRRKFYEIQLLKLKRSPE